MNNGRIFFFFFFFLSPYLAKGEENVANPLGSPKISPEFGRVWDWRFAAGFLFLRPKACGYFNPLPTEVKIHTLEMISKSMKNWRTFFFVFFPCCRFYLLSVYRIYFLDACWALRPLTKIFCSSIKKACTILSQTHLWHLEPPYVRDTVFMRRDMEHLYICRDGRTPCSFVLQSPHLGIVPSFLV